MKLKIALLAAAVFAGLAGAAIGENYPDVGNSWPLEPEFLTLKGGELIDAMQEKETWKETYRARKEQRAEKERRPKSSAEDERTLAFLGQSLAWNRRAALS